MSQPPGLNVGTATELVHRWRAEARECRRIAEEDPSVDAPRIERLLVRAAVSDYHADRLEALYQDPEQE